MLKYKLVLVKDMRKDAEKDAKAVAPYLVSSGTVTFDELCRDVAEESSLTSGDMKNVMDRLVRTIRKHVEAGRSVNCGELGIFSISLRSAVADDADSYDAKANMRAPKITYRPGKMLRRLDNAVTYERVKEKAEETSGGEEERPGEL